MQWGSVAEWVSGLGALAAAVVALRIAGDAESIAREGRRGSVRERRAVQLSRLIEAV